MDDMECVYKINITSLVDVALTLVIIFMMTAPFTIQNGILVNSSKMGAAQGVVAQAENVSITLDESGQIRVNGKEVSWEGLPLAARSALAKSRDKMVMLLASPKNNIKQVVDILDCAKQQGALKVAIMKKN